MNEPRKILVAGIAGKYDSALLYPRSKRAIGEPVTVQKAKLDRVQRKNIRREAVGLPILTDYRDA